ncbi:MAG: Zn-ribbon domain-containing OB-fold protein [Candidatus Micrarchaeota archaeon]|nr:Zn-ribbon domain-containing OB-fold protein [Candidatus Micrarchaeota archaeon]
MESMVTRFYKAVSNGKIYGVKCRKCGHFTFPPKAGCMKCGAHDMEWKLISGEGKLQFFSSGNLPPMKFAKYHPYAYGAVELKEGPCFFTCIEGLDVSNVEALEAQNAKMPMKVKAKIKRMADLDIVIFKVEK